MELDLTKLEKRINYTFINKELLENAMLHSSYVNEKHFPKYRSNERLEFLGDAVLELVSSEFLFFDDETMPEGSLTKLRASVVCEPTLASCARDLQLGAFLRLGKGEDRTGGRERDSIIADTIEALIGSIYLDGGFTNAKEFILSFILNDLENKKLFYDSKTILQEIVQARHNEGATYRLLAEAGPDHDKIFTVSAHIKGEEVSRGTGRTKKAAEQDAAYKAILSLQKNRQKES